MSVWSIVLFVLVAVAIGWGLWMEGTRVQRAERKAQKHVSKEQVLLASLGQRYQIKIADWGPDFDGVNTLPRWRWAVVDADHALRIAFDEITEDFEQKVFMLGNEHTKPEAYLAAAAWIEKQQHPVLVVDGKEL